MHPFRFAAMTGGASSRREIEETARKAEDLGYFAVHVNDHYLGPGPAMEAANHPPQPTAAIPTALVIADATTTLRVGFRVLCVDYHNPTVLAKSLATLDLFSGGRIEVGLGAGWIEAEYDAMGVAYDPPGVRIERLGEVIDVLRSSFTPGIVSIEGKHGVRAVGFEATPKPRQLPSPPIAIGGGRRRVLELAARKADIVCLNRDNSAGTIVPEGNRSTSAAGTLEKVGWIRDAAGDRFDQLELEIGAYYLTVTDDTPRAAEAWARRLGTPTEEVVGNPHVLIGSIDAICDQIEERRETFGVSYLTVLDRNIEAFAPVVERLSAK